MPLTKQIIQTIVHEEVHAAFMPVLKRLDGLDNNLKGFAGKVDHLEYGFEGLAQKVDNLANKVDNLTNIVTDFAGSVKKFDEEQVLLSARVSDVTDRVEKLEFA